MYEDYINYAGFIPSDSQGIVCECCIHGCDDNEIMEYCEDFKRRKRSTSTLDSIPDYFKTYLDEISKYPERFDSVAKFVNTSIVHALDKQKIINSRTLS